MSALTRTALLSALWVMTLFAALVVLAVGVVTLSDAALRAAFSIIGLVALLSSLLLFQAPQPAAPAAESRRATRIRATSLR
jgi:hypothetical protein